jgi:lipopolysaccharide assembly outer membrane protein LptD (OstA)
VRSDEVARPSWGGRAARGPILLAAAALLLLLASTASESAAQEVYRLRADRLEGSLSSGDNVYTAIRPTLIHGTTTVTGDSALVYREREFLVFRGNVKIVDGRTTMYGDEASYDRRDRLALLRGNVRIFEGGSRITGREAYFYRTRNLSVITGSPRLVDSTRTVTADRIEYDRNTDVVLALGHVDAVDTAESTRVVAGRVRYDRRSDYAWADTHPRLELTEANGLVTRVEADTLEFDNARDRVLAKNNVVVARETLRATAGRASFFRSENRALLVESPRAWDTEGTASGDTLEIRFVGNRVRSMQARPNAKVAYEAKADSGRAARVTASGDTITLFLEEEAARSALIVGHATSFYWPASGDSAQGGRNASTGDTIVVQFEGGRPARATVHGASQGTYYMVAEGDTTGAEARERIVYGGEQIVYDLRENTVDVTGSADVAYRDMRLRARQIRFDADTEQMRAEGNPVLRDGRDQINGETMTYDLRIQRGMITSGRTKYEQGYVTGKRVLRVTDDILDVESGTYTTCDLAEQHYHFGSNKMKILLHDKVVAKPVVFYIKKIPVLALPFYVFPINNERHSGFQLPQIEIGSSSAAGKFVRNVGYYWAINDHLDATLWGDYYQDRSWVGHAQTRYKKRYAYDGEFNGSYENRFGDAFTSAGNQWDLVGRHYQTLGRNLTVTAQANLTNSSAYYRDVFLGRSVLTRVQRNLRSLLGINRPWGSGSFTAGLERNQDLDPDPGGLRIEQIAPTVTFRLNSRPIGREARAGVPARLPWLARTSYSYETRLLSRKRIFVNLAGNADSIVDERTGMIHNLSLRDDRKLLGAIAVSPSIRASGIYYSRDQSGARNRIGGSWSTSLGANTQIFGTMGRSIGPLRALRHVVTPQASFTYSPRIRSLTFADTSGLERTRFTGIDGIGLTSVEQRSFLFGLSNDIHVKWGRGDRVKTINNLIHLGSSIGYDLQAKRAGRRPWTDINSSLNFRPIERSQFNFGFTHSSLKGDLLRYSASTGFALQGTSRAAEDSIQEMSDEPGEAAVREGNYLRPEGLVSSSLPWLFRFSIGVGGNRDAVGRMRSNATANSSLGINVSRNWRFDYSNQYDIIARTLNAQNFTIKRELHCWEAQFTRSLSGDVKEYYFKINVKLLPEVYYEQGDRGLRGFGGIQNLF